MSLDILKSIRNTEEEAEQGRKRSLADSNEILAEAKKEAYLIIEKEIEDSEKEADKMLLEAEESASGSVNEIRNNAKEECIKLRADTMKKFDEAVDIIAERIVKLHGNS